MRISTSHLPGIPKIFKRFRAQLSRSSHTQFRLKLLLSAFLLAPVCLLSACGQQDNKKSESDAVSREKGSGADQEYTLTPRVTELTTGLSAVKFEGDYGFDDFLSQGGASSDAEVVSYLTSHVLTGAGGFSFGGMPFGCSTISVKDEDGNSLFGRNFDWDACDAMIVENAPEHGYASISTVNTDFIQMSGLRLSDLPDAAQAVICLYAPLDGMNEQGLAVSVNMIQDSESISQNTGKAGLTTTTAIRLLLDQAATVEEAVELLGRYDLHASMGYMMHLAIADRSGASVVVEYIGNEMIVTQTPAVTNFYIAEGEKHGIGSRQSHERYEILIKLLTEHPIMNMDQVRDALDRVSKDNFNEFESTEWSVVFNQHTGEVHYYHRENYEESFIFQLT